jgi:hypothetical protein|tara:strand:- start:10475 stop:10597 length:123 start_codon:yes stop_codon:yes gene_type:complete
VLAGYGIHGLPFGEALLELIAVVDDHVELDDMLVKFHDEH